MFINIFALPLAVIVISIALQIIFKCPALVSAIIFSIFLVATFIIGNINFLIAAIVYAILSFITGYFCLISRLISRLCSGNCRIITRNCSCENNNDNNNTATTNDLLRISSTCGNSDDGTLLTISSDGLCSNRTGNSCRQCNRR